MNNVTLFLEQDGWTFSKFEARPYQEHTAESHSFGEENEQPLLGHAWRMRFISPEENVKVHCDGRSTHYTNFFLGNDRSIWADHVFEYSHVAFESVWSGIDLSLQVVDGNFKYDVLLDAGADVREVAFRYEGLDSMELGAQGSLIMYTSVGALEEIAPVAYYADEEGGAIDCAFVLTDGMVGFRFPSGVDRDRPVVIDPVLVAATFSGNLGLDLYGYCATYDLEGNIFTGAEAHGYGGFPITVGAFQSDYGGMREIVLSKLNPDGSELIWATYFGGNDNEYPHSMITTTSGELIVLCATQSSDFPVTDGAFDTSLSLQDIGVFHLSQDGASLLGSTFVGGSGYDGTDAMGNFTGHDRRGEVILDANENILIASFTSSSDFPVTPGVMQSTFGGGQDGVILKLDPNCTQLLASTFLGGENRDSAMALRVAFSGEIFVTGTTGSGDFPMPSGGYSDSYTDSYDAYVVRISPGLSEILAGTFYGTESSERSYFIDLDANGDVWIFGTTQGTIPVFPSGIYGVAWGTPFVAKFNADLTEAPVRTTLPGELDPVAFMVDHCGRIYLSGYYPDGELTLTPDAFYPDGGFYLGVFDTDMSSILFGTYYGGLHVDGGSSRYDKRGVVYQAVCSSNSSGLMQAVPWAYDTSQGQLYDVGVFKVEFDFASLSSELQVASRSGCAPATFTLSLGANVADCVWDLDDGSGPYTGNEVTVTYPNVGSYEVQVIGLMDADCGAPDTAVVVLTVHERADVTAKLAVEVESSCDGYRAVFVNGSSGATDYVWDLGDDSSATGTVLSHVYDAPGTYLVHLTSINALCSDTATATAPLVFEPASFEYGPESPVVICDDALATLDAGAGFDSYAWSTGSAQQMIQVTTPGEYTIGVVDGVCEETATMIVQNVPRYPTMPDATICSGIQAHLMVPFDVQEVLWSTGAGTSSISVDEEGLYWFDAIDAYGCPASDTMSVIIGPEGSGMAVIPNVFSPNGDGRNDTFSAEGLGIDQFTMTVFDRWGLKMFETADPVRGWNGGLANAPAAPVPEGTYYYVIELVDGCSDVGRATFTGHVTLLRN